MAAGASAHGPDAGGLASLTANMMDEGTADSVVPLEIAFAAEIPGNEPVRQLRLGRLLCRPPVPDPAPGAEPRPGARRAPPTRPSRRPNSTAIVGPDPGGPEGGARQPPTTRPTGRSSAPLSRTRILTDRRWTARSRPSPRSRARRPSPWFHRENYRPDRSAIVVAGDVDPDRMAGLRRRALRLVGRTGPDDERDARDGPRERPRILLVDRRRRAAGRRPGGARRPAALDAGPRRLDALQPGPGGPVQLPAQRQTPRGEGLHLRRPQSF